MARKRVERGIAYDDARNKYYVTLDYGRDRAGNRRKQCTTYANLAAARKALREFEQQRQGTEGTAPSELTLGQWLDQWMAEVIVPNRAVTTAYDYREMIRNYIDPLLGSVPLRELSPRDIQHYYACLREEWGLGAYTVRHHHDMLGSALRLAVKQDLIARSPTDRVEPPRVPPREARFYGPGDLAALYRAVDGTWLETVVKLAGNLGLRREEICGLRWEHVDFGGRRIHVCEARTSAGAQVVQKETKNRTSTRTLHMTDEIRDVLLREKRRQARICAALDRPPCGFVTVDERGEAQSPNVVSMAFMRLIRREGLPAITLHGLRHTFATIASAQGAPLFEISKALGHSTPATTGKIYTHLLDQTHEETIARVEDALRGNE